MSYAESKYEYTAQKVECCVVQLLIEDLRFHLRKRCSAVPAWC